MAEWPPTDPLLCVTRAGVSSASSASSPADESRARNWVTLAKEGGVTKEMGCVSGRIPIGRLRCEWRLPVRR